MPLVKGGETPDDPAIDQCAEDRPPFYALKVPQSEDQKTHHDTDQTAAAVIAGLKLIYGNMKIRRQLLDEQLIHLR